MNIRLDAIVPIATLLLLSSCAREVTRPDPITNGPEPNPDLRAVEGSLYWPNVPIGVELAHNPRTASLVAAHPAREVIDGRTTHEQNIVVVGTGCLPSVRQYCVGSFPDYRIHYYIDDVLWWDRTSSASSGSGLPWESFFGLIWTPADTGLHTVRVVLDATNRYQEIDETNNETRFQVRVIPADLVAGMIEAIEWRQGYPHRVTSVRAGTPLDVVTWSFARGRFANHRSVFEVNGTTLFDRRITLMGGTLFPDIRTDTVRFVPSAPGVYTFQRSADPDAEFQDGNRTNNVRSSTLTVTPG